MNFETLKPINQCKFTSLETKISSISYNDMEVIHLCDENSRNRFIVVAGEEVISCLMFDEGNVCMFRETSQEYRRQGLQNNLWLFAASILGDISHSEDLTEEGQTLRGVRN